MTASTKMNIRPQPFDTLATYTKLRDAGLDHAQARAITYAIAQAVGISDPCEKQSATDETWVPVQ